MTKTLSIDVAQQNAIGWIKILVVHNGKFGRPIIDKVQEANHVVVLTMQMYVTYRYGPAR